MASEHGDGERDELSGVSGTLYSTIRKLLIVGATGDGAAVTEGRLGEIEQSAQEGYADIGGRHRAELLAALRAESEARRTAEERAGRENGEAWKWIMELRELIRHAWVHTSYPDCGYQQMTTEQKALYDKTIGRKWVNGEAAFEDDDDESPAPAPTKEAP